MKAIPKTNIISMVVYYYDYYRFIVFVSHVSIKWKSFERWWWWGFSYKYIQVQKLSLTYIVSNEAKVVKYIKTFSSKYNNCDL